MEIIGKLKEVTQIEQIPTKSGSIFEKRSIVLDCSRTDEWTGDVYTNILSFEVAPSKVHDYDNLNGLIGRAVVVKFAINGRVTETQLGDKRYFTTLRCLGVTPYVKVQQFANMAQQPTAQPVQQFAPQQVSQQDEMPF